MAIRLVITITAKPGSGAALARGYQARCAEAMKEPGCEQFEVFQSVVHPDKVVILELWSDQAALDSHAKLNTTRPQVLPELRVGPIGREDYEYKRTR